MEKGTLIFKNSKLIFRHVEKKFSNQAQTKGKNGKILSEKQEMYKNSKTGEKRVAKERTFDEQGRKMVRKKYGNGDEQMFNQYQGFEEEHAGVFDNRWENEAKNIGFYDSVGGMLGYKNGPRVIQNDSYGGIKKTKKNPQNRNQAYDDEDDIRIRVNNFSDARGLGMPSTMTSKVNKDNYADARGLGMPANMSSKRSNEPHFASTAELKGSTIKAARNSQQ